MRIALLSDIHGNSIALDAVLADIKTLGGVTDYWILGDLAGLGPDPVGVIERVAALHNTVVVRGNTDHYIVAEERPGPHAADVQEDFGLLELYGIVAKQLGWTAGAVAATGWLAWVDALPVEAHLTLPNGTQLLGVHASPGCYGGTGIHPELSDAELRYMLGDCDADLVCVGHTHWPMDVRVANGRGGETHIVNLGCVSNPHPPDLRACYVILDADEKGYRVEHRRVDYDREAVIAQIRQVRYPNGQFVIDSLNGLHGTDWRAPKMTT